MSDLERLQDGELSSLERSLLASAASDAPRPEGVKRAALALGLAPPASLAPPVLGSLSAGHWASGTLLVAALAAGGYWLGASASPGAPELPRPAASFEVALPPAPLSSDESAPRAAAPPSGPTPSGPTPSGAPTPHAEPSRTAPSTTDPASGTRRVSRTDRPVSPSLGEQVAHVDAIRALLARSATNEALAEIARYRELYPRGALRQEAFLLELEAWRASGQAARARRAAEDFLRRFPTSPHAERVARFTQVP